MADDATPKPGQPENDEFVAFDELTRKLVQVKKDDLPQPQRRTA